MLMRNLETADLARTSEALPAPGVGPRILIDALNVDLAQGTGVKSYAYGLDAALRANGHQPCWLYGREIAASDDGLATGAAFFGQPQTPRSRLGRRLRLLGLYRRAWFAGRRRAQAVDLRHIITAPDAGLPTDVMNVSALHETAMLRHHWRGRFTRVVPSRPVDIFHLTYPHPLEVEGARTVVTIHDLVPLRLPYLTLDIPAEVVARHRRAAKRAALIFTVSELSKRDICSLLEVDPAKVVVTYQTSALPRLNRAELNDLPDMLATQGLQPGGYLLFVGAVEPKKNLGRLIQAALASDLKMPLVIAGPRAWLADQELAALHGRNDGCVRYLGYQTTDGLRALYAGARAFVFPSLYEGFGVPVLEALNFGLPILAAGNSALPEVAGPAAIYADPYDVRALRAGLEQLGADDALCGRLRLAAPRQAARFSPARYRQRLSDAYGLIAS